MPTPEQASAVPAPPCVTPPDATRWFKEEVHPHDAQLKSWLRGAFPAVKSDVEDVVQESYLRVWKRHATRPIESAKAFLYKAAKNIAIDLLRRNRASPVDTLSTSDASLVISDAPSAVDRLSSQERFEILAQAVAALPDRMREVILLHKIEGLSQKEVAEKLGLTERTVQNHTLRGVKHCEEFFRSRGFGGFREP